MNKNVKKKTSKRLFLYIVPGLVVVFLFEYFALWGWLFAFFNYKPGKNLFDCEFVGFNNFKLLFGNAVMRTQLFNSLRNTFAMNGLEVLVSPIVIILAIFLSEVRNQKFKKAVQTLTTLPNFVGWVIVYSLALNLFSYDGLLNDILMNWGIISKPINFLATDKHVWVTQTLLSYWKGAGWSAIVYLAAITGIDPELYEAAMMDGAGMMRRIWHITVPHLLPTFFVVLVISFGKFLNTGTEQYLVFGNPMNMEYIETLDYYVYNLGLGSGLLSYSVAVGIMKSVVALVMFGSANWLSKKIRGISMF